MFTTVTKTRDIKKCCLYIIYFNGKKSGRYESKIKGRGFCVFQKEKSTCVVGEAERGADSAAG
jgi:hypothetical protein